MWAAAEFNEGMQGLHGRSRKSLARAGFILSQKVGTSFSAALGNSFRQDVAAIFAKESMQAEGILQGHFAATFHRAKEAEGGFLILAQDTTTFNYNAHKKKKGLTSLQEGHMGLLQHNALLMDAEGLPLGLAFQHAWARGGEGADLLPKESDKWYPALEAAGRLARETPKTVLLVQDREADILPFFKAKREKGVELIVRMRQKRTFSLAATGERFKLEQAREKLPRAGEAEVWIWRSGRSVRLTLEVRAGEVNVLSPKSGKEGAEGATLISARETGAVDEQGRDCYGEEEAAEWLLLSTLALGPDITALDAVKYYSFRWRIERFHYVEKKGGMNVEALLFEDVHTLINALAFYSVIAWRILYLTYLARKEPDVPASNAFEEEEIAVLEQTSGKKLQTLAQAMKALGKLAGFQPSKKYPLPGAKKLGEALNMLHHMTLGYKLAMKINPTK